MAITTNIETLAKKIAMAGSPLIGTCLGILLPPPFDLIVKSVMTSLGDIFNVDSNDLTALHLAIDNDNNAAEKLQQIEDDHREDLQTVANMANRQIDSYDTNTTTVLNKDTFISIFFAGWRPAFAWICVFMVAYSIITSAIPSLPQLQIADFYPIWAAFCGLLGLRSFEKFNGIASGSLSKLKK